jgi:hypothetical protein
MYVKLKTFQVIAFQIDSRVARWYIFKPKITILEGLALEDVGIFYGHLVYFTTIRHIWVYFIVIWYVLPILVFCIKMNLATLNSTDPTRAEIHQLKCLSCSFSLDHFLWKALAGVDKARVPISGH